MRIKWFLIPGLVVAAGAGQAGECDRWQLAVQSAAAMQIALATQPDLAVAPSCAPSERAGEHFACVAQHPLRDLASVADFERLSAVLGHCFEATPDAGVNHPDTYHAVRYDAGRDVMLVYKDKSALGLTLVTVRILETR